MKIILGLVLGLAVAAGVNVPRADAADRVKVVTSVAGLIFAPVYIAQQQGYFKAAGLDVTVQDGNGGSNAVAAIVGGSAQIGIIGFKNVTQAVDKGQALKLVGTGLRGFPQTLVIRPDLAAELKVTPASTLAEKGAALRGRNIAVTDIGGSTGDFARLILRAGGVADDQATVVNITTIAGQLAALKARRIDAFVNSSPAGEIATADGYGVELVVPARDLRDVTDIEYTVQTVRQDFLEKNPAVVERYLGAVQKALDLIRTDPNKAKAAAYDFFAEQANTDEAFPAAIRDAAWANLLPHFPATVVLDPAKVKASRIFLKASDISPDAVLIDNRLASKVAP